MKKLSSELNLIVSTKSFMYVKEIIDLYQHTKDYRVKKLWEIYNVLAKKYNVSIEAINMGVFPYLQQSMQKIKLVYPHIKPNNDYTLDTKEILVRLADICEEKGCEF